MTPSTNSPQSDRGMLEAEWRRIQDGMVQVGDILPMRDHAEFADDESEMITMLDNPATPTEKIGEKIKEMRDKYDIWIS